MKTSDFEYNLPKELIAQKALAKRDNARLMAAGKEIAHDKFSNIINYLNKGDVLVINDTKVMKAKINGRKITGSPAEVIIERKCPDYYECMVKTKTPKLGNIIDFGDGIKAEIVGKNYDCFFLKFNKKIEDIIKKTGELPQPTYIKRKITEKEYQTVYAKKGGSVAAPTAGLHFTKKLLKKIEAKGIKIARVCLHIGFGTFIPIAEEDYTKHRIHSEYFEIGKDAADAINSCKGRLVAVGTTSLRALESAEYLNGKIQPAKGMSNVFIAPGYKFKSKTSMLITNFHLPRSTLILMVSAFAGRDIVMNAYKEAVKEKYRFYSLGDAMILPKL